MSSLTREVVIGRLAELLVEACEGDLGEPFPTSGEDSIRALGVTSVRMLAFLVAVEDEFGMEWDETVDPEVIRSFERMADHVLDCLPASTGAPS